MPVLVPRPGDARDVLELRTRAAWIDALGRRAGSAHKLRLCNGIASKVAVLMLDVARRHLFTF